MRRISKGRCSFGLETYQLAIPTLPPAILVNDTEILQFVLKNHEIFVKGKLFRRASWDLFGWSTNWKTCLLRWFLRKGNGILNTDGDLWKIQRKAGLRFFTNSNIQHFIDVVLPPFIRQLHKRLEIAAREGSVVDLQNELLQVTTGLMGRVAYDVSNHP